MCTAAATAVATALATALHNLHWDAKCRGFVSLSSLHLILLQLPAQLYPDMPISTSLTADDI